MSAAKWVEVPASALKGQGLKPYRPGEIANLFDWAENPQGQSKHLMPHRRQLLIDIVEIEANAVHQPSKPGDEIVKVLNGCLQLTDDADKREQLFEAGEMVLIPAGWAGVYRVIPENGDFREFTIVPGDYFDPGVAPPPNKLSPRRIDLPRASGIHVFHKGRYVIEAQNINRASVSLVAAAADEIIQVLAGTLTLIAAGDTASFGPGSVVVLPKGFKGQAKATAGYRALNARWIG